MTVIDTAGFAASLRAATTTDHQGAESDSFMTRLLAGELDTLAYHRLTVQYLAVYTALEQGVAELREHPQVAPFHDERLARVSSLEADLAWLRERHGSIEETVLPATARYVDRITEAARGWPAGLIAHHYTRYLGDLSGGVHIGRVLDRQLDGGTSFYRFDAIADLREFKRAYRDHLDAAPWGAAEQERVTQEVAVAYALNRAVFAELDVSGQARTAEPGSTVAR